MEPYIQTVIFDMDGTLCDISHRIHYISGRQADKNYDKFHTECVNDTPHLDVIQLLKIMWEKYFVIAIVSGRSDMVRTETMEWLKKYDIPYQYLFMRKHGDHRPDWLIKRDILTNELKDHNVFCAFDDRDQVVSLWRSKGIRCYQVAKGNF